MSLFEVTGVTTFIVEADTLNNAVREIENTQGCDLFTSTEEFIGTLLQFEHEITIKVRD